MKTQYSMTLNNEDSFTLVAVMFSPVYIKLLSMCVSSARRMGIIPYLRTGRTFLYRCKINA